MVKRRRLLRKAAGPIERRRLVRKRSILNEESTSSEQVGYGNPPRHTRWAPGRSGNPGGRPKGKKNFRTELNEELETTVTVVENGVRRKIKKRKAIAKQLVNRAVAGDHRFTATVLNEIRNLEAQIEAQLSNPKEASREDRSVMEGILRRIRGAATESTRELDENVSRRTDPSSESDP